MRIEIIVATIILSASIPSCGQSNLTNEYNNISKIEDEGIRYEKYINYPFKEDWFNNQKSIEKYLGNPNSIKEEQNFTQWKEDAVFYELIYDGLIIKGYQIINGREEVYRIEYEKNIFGLMNYANIGATKELWKKEMGDPMEEDEERMIYGTEYGIIMVVEFVNDKAVKVSKNITG